MISQTTDLTLNMFPFQVLFFWDAAQPHRRTSLGFFIVKDQQNHILYY